MICEKRGCMKVRGQAKVFLCADSVAMFSGDRGKYSKEMGERVR